MTVGGKGLTVLITEDETIYCQTLMDSAGFMIIKVYERFHPWQSPKYMKDFPPIGLDLPILEIQRFIKTPAGTGVKHFFDFKIKDIDDALPNEIGLTITYDRSEVEIINAVLEEK